MGVHESKDVPDTETHKINLPLRAEIDRLIAVIADKDKQIEELNAELEIRLASAAKENERVNSPLAERIKEMQEFRNQLNDALVKIERNKDVENQVTLLQEEIDRLTESIGKHEHHGETLKSHVFESNTTILLRIDPITKKINYPVELVSRPNSQNTKPDCIVISDIEKKYFPEKSVNPSDCIAISNILKKYFPPEKSIKTPDGAKAGLQFDQELKEFTTSQWLKNSGIKSIEEWVDQFTNPENAVNHPEFTKFKRGIAKLNGSLSEEQIKNLFSSIFQGLKEHASKMKKCQDLIGTVYKGKTISSEEDCKQHDELNYAKIQAFVDFVQLFKDKLAPSPGQSTAFWSGGFGLSGLAKGDKFEVLEFSPLGEFLSGLYFKPMWKNRIAALWDVMSRQYTENVAKNLKDYPEAELHIYLRTFDEGSYLHKQELPDLKTKLSEEEWKKVKVKVRLFHGDDHDIGKLYLDKNGNPNFHHHSQLEDINLKNVKERHSRFVTSMLTTPEYRAKNSGWTVYALLKEAYNAKGQTPPTYEEFSSHVDFSQYFDRDQAQKVSEGQAQSVPNPKDNQMKVNEYHARLTEYVKTLGLE